MNDKDVPRVRRSELTTPAGSRKMILGAAEKSQADVVILDLEDATAQSAKQEARETMVAAAREADWSGRQLSMRPNPVGTKWFEADLRAAVEGFGGSLVSVVLAKVDGPETVQKADRLLGELEASHGLEPGGIALEVLIESPRAVLEMERIAGASKRMEALIFGVADYAALVGARLQRDVFTDFSYVKQRIVTVARAYGLSPIDCVTFQYKDEALTRQDAKRAFAMGFDGKWCIHPVQVPLVNEAFTPDDETVAWAQKVVAAHEQGEREKKGAVVVEGEMVDMATVRVARRVLAVRGRG